MSLKKILRMKKSLCSLFGFLALELFAPKGVHAESTTYISNLAGSPLGIVAIASNARLAQSFKTGASSLGYNLNAVQLSLDVASGNPDGFTVSLFADNNFHPGISLGNLTGSANPTGGGIFSYSATNTILSPSTKYWIVLAAQTPLITGNYNSRFTSFFNYSSLANWSMDRYYEKSTDGINWTDSNVGYDLQFSVTATAIPEPSSLALWLTGGILAANFIRRREANQQGREHQPDIERF